MNQEERFSVILSQVKSLGLVKTKDLRKKTGISEVTLRKDLEILEKRGQLIRIRGGAIAPEQYGENERECTPSEKEEKHELEEYAKDQEQEELVKQAVADIQDGESIMLPSGKFSVSLAKQLLVKNRLRVITDSSELVRILGTKADFRLILIGGEMNQDTSIKFGSDSMEQISRYKADICIISADGITEKNISCESIEEAVRNRYYLQFAHRNMIIAYSESVGKRCFCEIMDTARADQIITGR